MSESYQPSTAAEALLMRLKLNGVDYLFANAGTDFAPVIEGYATAASNTRRCPNRWLFPMRPRRLRWPTATTWSPASRSR